MKLMYVRYFLYKLLDSQISNAFLMELKNALQMYSYRSHIERGDCASASGDLSCYQKKIILSPVDKYLKLFLSFLVCSSI